MTLEEEGREEVASRSSSRPPAWAGVGGQVLAEAEPQISVLLAPNPLVPEP